MKGSKINSTDDKRMRTSNVSLIRGELCLEYKCFKCCLETEMILSFRDLYELVRRGHNLQDFAYFDGRYWRLMNVEGKCYFLSSDGLCRVHQYKPQGCRAYPVILIDTSTGFLCSVDDYCTLHNRIRNSEIIIGCKIISNLIKEIEV